VSCLPGPKNFFYLGRILAARIGTLSGFTSHKPGSRLVAPDPAIVQQAVGWPVSFPQGTAAMGRFTG